MTATEAPASQQSQLKDGRIVAIVGPVVDVEFPPDSLPEINFALEFTIDTGDEKIAVVAEVAQHIGESRVRAIAMKPTDGLKRGAIVKPEPGKAKISIRLDNAVIEYFRNLVDKAGGGNYQTLINDALLEHLHRRSTLDAVRQVVREEIVPYGAMRRGTSDRRQTRPGPGARRAALRTQDLGDK